MSSWIYPCDGDDGCADADDEDEDGGDDDDDDGDNDDDVFRGSHCSRLKAAFI